MTRKGKERTGSQQPHLLSQVTYPGYHTRSEAKNSITASMQDSQLDPATPSTTFTQVEPRPEEKAIFDEVAVVIQDTARAHTGESLEQNLLCLLSGMAGVPFYLPSLTADSSERAARSKAAFLASVLTEAGSLDGAEWGAYLGYIHEVVGGMLGWLAMAEREWMELASTETN